MSPLFCAICHVTVCCAVVFPAAGMCLLQVGDDMQHAQQVQMGLTDASPPMMLGSGALSDAVTAAMHAVPSGNVYWGDAAAVQPGPGMSAQDIAGTGDGLQHEGALQPHLTGEPLWLPQLYVRQC